MRPLSTSRRVTATVAQASASFVGFDVNLEPNLVDALLVAGILVILAIIILVQVC